MKERALTPKEKAIRWYWERVGLPEVNAKPLLSDIAQDSDLGLAIDIALEEQFKQIFADIEQHTVDIGIEIGETELGDIHIRKDAFKQMKEKHSNKNESKER